jgi:NAD(P)-dependent dehydrogenase (short-subunit alcohol dehydrogenase family)
MSLYRADPKDGVAWVTGASTGIGRQLALDLAREGYTVAATARGEDKLATLSAEAAAFKGRIVSYPADVTDESAMDHTVAAIESSLGPIVLAIFNAGNYYPARGDHLVAEKFVKTYEINVFGVVYGLVPVVARMEANGRGQVAITGSVSGFGGLPMASAYGASKAALTNMAAALKFDFDPMNIRIQIINPGFVETPLTEKNNFPMPGLMKVDDASKRIVQGLKTGGFELTFPRRLSWTLKLMNMLPYSIYFPLMARAMGWDKGKSRK